jgi:hypothetical protein
MVGTEQQPMVSSRSRRLAAATPLVGVVCMVAGFLAAWNPWRLVVLDGRVGLAGLAAMTFGVLMVGVGVARLVGRRRRAWWWLSACVSAVGGSLFVLVLLVVLLAGLLTPFAGDVLDEDRVDVGDGVTVVRRVWSSGALHSCVNFEVRVGHGIRTRSGAQTSCVDNRNSPDWEVSAADGTVVVVRSDGSNCRYSIDRANLRLVAEDAVACGALVVT